MKMEKKILISGGTGSLGYELTRLCLKSGFRVVVYSRNEERQFEMEKSFSHPCLEFRLGDVRDTETLSESMRGCQWAVHAAAMKDLIMCEKQPTQACFNNIDGSRSFIRAAKQADVDRVIAISTDKAASPSSAYGATKYLMEKLFCEANVPKGPKFMSVRFGNIIDSRGSLIHHWKAFPEKEIFLTHPEVSRFFFSLKEAASFVLFCMMKGKPGEIFVKKMKKARIKDILELITKKKTFKIMGLFPGEKIHEDLVGDHEVAFCFEERDYFVIRPGVVNPAPPKPWNTECAPAFSRRQLETMIFPEHV